MALYSDEQKRQLLTSNGFDPDRFDLDDSGEVNEKIGAQFSPPSSPTSNANITPVVPQPAQTSALPAFGRSVAASAFPTVAGLAGGAATGAGIGALGGFAAPITVPLGAIIGGIASSYGASKLQEAVLPESVNQQLAVDAQQHPFATAAGSFVPAMAAFNPIKGIQQLPTLAKGAGKMIGLGGEAITAGEKAAILNAAINAGTSAGQDIYSQMQSPEPFSPLQLAGNTAMGVILNEPTRLGRAIGFTSPMDIDAQLAAQRNLVLEQARIAAASQQPVVEVNPALRQTPQPGIAPRVETYPKPIDMLGSELGGRRERGAMSKYKGAVEPVDIPTFENEGGGNFPVERDVDFNLARQELINEQMRNTQLQTEQVKQQTDSLRQQNEQLQKSLTENQVRITTPSLERSLVENQTQKGFGLGFAQESTPEPIHVTPYGDLTFPDYTSRTQLANKEVASQNDLEYRRMEGNRDKYQSPENKPHPYDKLTWEQLPASFKSKVLDLAQKRGISVEQARQIIDPRTGQEKLGSFTDATRTAKVSSSIGRGDTGPHEIAHGYLDDLLNSAHMQDRKLAQDALDIFGGDREMAEEALVMRLGAEGHERIKTMLDGSALKRFTEFFKDFTSRVKYKTGLGNEEDVIRHLSQRQVTDAPFGMRGEIDLTKPKYAGFQKGGEGLKGTKLYNLQQDITDEEGKVIHAKGSTVSEDTLKERGIKYQDALPYGYWMDKEGNMHPVKSHEQFAKDFVKNNLTPEEQQAINFPLSSTTELEGELFKRGYARLVHDRDTLYSNSKLPLTNAQLRNLKNHGIENKLNVRHGKDEYKYETSIHDKEDRFQDKSALDFTTSLDKELQNERPFNLTLDKEDKVASQSILGRMNDRLPKDEMAALRESGLDDFLASQKGKVSTKELKKWLEENGPKVEVKKFGEGTMTSEQKEYAQLRHEFYDNLSPLEQSAVRNMRRAYADGSDFEGAWNIYSKGNIDKAKAKRYVELMQKLDETTEPLGEKAHWSFVAPKAEKDMPGYVEIAVVKGLSKDIANHFSQTMPKFPESHNFPPNTLGFLRGYMETTKDGKKVFHIVEVQSDWGQRRRHDEQVLKERPESDIDTKRYPITASDPALNHYESLALKAAIKHAKENGADAIAISDAETAMLTEGHDRAAKRTVTGEFPYSPDLLVTLKGQYGAGTHERVGDKIISRFATPEQTKYAVNQYGGKVVEHNDISQEKGMRLHYDDRLQNIAKKLTESEGIPVEFGEHKQAVDHKTPKFVAGEYFVPEIKQEVTLGDRRIPNGKVKVLEDGTTQYQQHTGEWEDIYLQDERFKQKIAKAVPLEPAPPRKDLIFKNPDGTPKTSVTAKMYPLQKIAPRLESGEPFSTYKTSYSSQSALDIPFLKPEITKIEKDFGPEGEKVAKGFTKFYEDFRGLKGKLTNSVVGELREHLNFANPKELATQNNEKLDKVRAYMDDVADNGYSTITLSPEEKQIEKSVRDFMALTLAEKNSRPGLPTTNANEDYFPHVMSRDVLNTLLNTTGAKRVELIQDFLNYHKSIGTPDPEEALKIFMAGYKNTSKNLAEQFGPIDKSAGVGIPQSWREKNLIDRMARFGNRYARRIAYHDAIESQPEVIKSLEDSRSGIQNADIVRNVMDDIAGRREHEEAKRTAISGVIRAGMLGPLTGTKDFVANLTLGLQHQTPSQSVLSLMHAWGNMKDSLEGSFRSGVNRYNISSFEFGDGGIDNLTNILRSTRDILNTVQGRNLLERVTRATAFGQGKFLAMDNLEAMVKGKPTSQGRKFFEDFGEGIDLKKAISEKEFSPEDLDKIAARYVESVQGTYDYRGLPAVAQRGSLAPVLSLARWNIEKMNNFMKYNIQPARQGNFTPLLMSTLGMIIGGEAVTKLVEAASGRKEKTPSISEVASGFKEGAEGSIPAAAYKLAALSSMAGYAGMLGDVVKSAMDSQFKNRPTGYNNPLVEGVTQGVDLMEDVVEAMRNGDLDITADAISKVLETYFQAYRLGLNQLSTTTKEQAEKSNMLRDLKVYKQLHGLPVGDTSGITPNPFINKGSREFKKSKDLEEAMKMLPDLLKKSFAKSEGDPERLKAELTKLKTNNYETMPSLERTPIAFFRYLNYLRSKGGEQLAQERLQDYLMMQAINKAKSEMIPSL